MQTDTILADYRFFDERGELLDSSEQSGPLRFIPGQGQVLPAIEAALLQLEVGQGTELHLSPEQAYGEHRPELVFEAVRENLPQDIDLTPGARLYSGTGNTQAFQLRVLHLTEQGAMLDGNHPLAGKSLYAELIRRAPNAQ